MGDGGEPADEHVGDTVPVEETDERFGIEWRRVGVAHAMAGRILMSGLDETDPGARMA